jgi:hypothetical protein
MEIIPSIAMDNLITSATESEFHLTYERGTMPAGSDET